MPRGWIETTSQWLQGLSIAFAPLNLVLLASSWPPRWNVTGTAHVWLFVWVGLVPVMVPFLSEAPFERG